MHACLAVTVPPNVLRRRAQRVAAAARGGVMRGQADEVICVVLREWVDLSPEVLDDALMAYVAFIEATAARVDRHDPKPEQRQWTLICDCAGLGLSSVPLSFLKQINRIFEPNYPHRLRKSVMVPIPRIVTKMVSAMMVFVAESTRRKFVMVPPPEHNYHDQSSGLTEICLRFREPVR
jgi:hypothetical protein